MMPPMGLVLTAPWPLSSRIERGVRVFLTVYGGHATIRTALLPLSMRLKVPEGLT